MLYIRRQSYKLENWLHFTECQSQYIFKAGILPPKLQACWDQLVPAVIHYCRPDDIEAATSDAARQQQRDRMLSGMQAAHKHLLQYGRLLEAMSAPDMMFTSNLHLVTCR